MSNTTNVLLVDDDERLRNAAGKVLAAEGYQVTRAASGAEALEQLKQPGFALVISDLRLPDLDGIALLKKTRELLPDAEVVMITGHGSVEKAVEAMRLGAYDFIQKPLDSAALLKTVAKALEKQRLASENRLLRRQLQQRRGVDALIGDSPAMQSAKQLVRQIAPTEVNVLIQGESGTGKEIVADALHYLSERRERPLVKISCAAIPETLLESELFGHERGAFTGAAAAKPGKFELADNGTLLLDEIAEMSPQLQAKLLRVLQDGRFQRLGGTKEMQGNVRLLCATHTNIPKAIAEGKFRHDLYYRINTVQIVLPPLRERREDIALLAGHYLGKFAGETGKEVRAIAPGAMQQLLAHPWPGNVRELEHVLQRAVILASGKIITNFVFAPPANGTAELAPAARDGPVFPFPLALRWMRPPTGSCGRPLSSARATSSRRRGCSASRRARCIGVSRSRRSRFLQPDWQCGGCHTGINRRLDSSTQNRLECKKPCKTMIFCASPSVGIALANNSLMTTNAMPNKTILIVDDDARMLRALEKVLHGEGMTVIPAFEASEAVEILTQRTRRVDLVITDLRMPFVNGITLLYAIHEILPALPVIVLTAFGDPDVRAECYRQGAAAFLEKPMDCHDWWKRSTRFCADKMTL